MTERVLTLLKVQAEDDIGQIGRPHGDCQDLRLSYPPIEETKSYDKIFVYAHSLEDMRRSLSYIHKTSSLRPQGSIFILYPKLKNPAGITGIHRDLIFPYLGVGEDGVVAEMPYMFYKMISGGEVYTVIGLRGVGHKAKSSHGQLTVAQYEKYLPELLSLLSTEDRAAFERLPAGYQRGWVVYVYSPRMAATRVRRHAYMLEAVRRGYKTVEEARKHIPYSEQG